MNGLDVMMVVLYFAALIFVGVLGARKAKTSEDYIVAGRNLGLTMYLACLAAVILGGASTIGTAKLGYQFGLSGIWMVFMLGLGISAIGVFLIRKMMALKVLTISEVLEKRFNSETRLISSLVAAIYTLMVTVTQVISMGTILNVLLGWNLTLSMITGGGIVLFYTLLGGMWAITMTDIIQFVIMTVGIYFIMLPMSLHKAGGWSTLLERLPPGYFDAGSIGMSTIFQYFLLFCLGMAVGQDIWQRVFTARTTKIARAGTIGAGVYSCFYAVAVCLIGMCAYVVLPHLKDPQTAFSSMALATLPPGILGVVIASVISALMSTASGTMLASSTLIVNDILKRYMSPQMNEQHFLKISRLTTFAVGITTIVISIWIQDVLTALDVAYAVLSGAIFFPIILGFFWKRATAQAAFYSILLSTAVILAGLAIKGVSSTEPIVYGLLVSIIVMITVSLAGTSKKEPAALKKSEPYY